MILFLNYFKGFHNLRCVQLCYSAT